MKQTFPMKQSVDAASRALGLIEEGEAFRRLNADPRRKRFDVIVIGGGQAGLSVGYHLQKLGVDFVIVDASERIGDGWRTRWDTLRLFSSNRYNGLDGLPFPGAPGTCPTKDEMAEYLERYAAHFQLPIMSGARVDRLSREGARYVVRVSELELEATHVVVAMSSYQVRKVPAFAKELSPEIVQLHVSEYKGLSQLNLGGVLVVGAANSGAEIAKEAVSAHPTWLSAGDPGEVPFPIDKRWVQLFVISFLFRVIFHRLLTVSTAIGRRVRAKTFGHGVPRIRQRRRDLVREGVAWSARTIGVRDGLPLLSDGRTLEVRNVIWCAGYANGLSWIDLPIFDNDGEPRHKSGLVESEPGLYFVGQHFQHAMSSAMIHGVGRDAARMVGAIRRRQREGGRAEPQGARAEARP
jgi:putative flavoprotein involved in K+ transport